MTDNNPSGAPEAPAAESTAPAAGAPTPAGSFGSTRGSGLARGKRSQGAAAPKASAAPADYKPTAVQIITAQREYTNPFASPAPADAPAPAPAVIEAVAPAPVAEPVSVPEAAPTPAPVAAVAPEVVESPKAEIQILPPAEVPRQSVSWESGPSAAPERPRRDERPTFKPDRRPEPAAGGPSEVRDQRRDNFRRQPRDPRDERPQGERREYSERREPAVTREPSAPQSKGFFGWLKGLFGGAKPAVETPAEPQGGSFQGDGQRHRRRHRGGRGHGGGGGGGQPGFRNDRPQGMDRPSGGDRPQGSGEFDGPRRRRHRGGRGRNRGGEPRPEGHQGGGAI